MLVLVEQLAEAERALHSDSGGHVGFAESV